MELPWLKYFVDAWHDRVAGARVPHAVLLAGPVGVGKRAAARWLVGETLGSIHAALPEHPQAIPAHADLHWLRPPDDKASIGIEQVRELVGEFGLTSYEGGRKVAVIEPADAMTINAANSQLKTLEEPPGDALLILIADRVGRLPATIFSRCQRIDMAAPAEADARAWLDRLQPGAPWAQALRAAGGAPLAAIEALEQLDTGAAMARDLNALGQGQAAAVEVAARWAQLTPTFVFEWLVRQLEMAIIAASAGRDSAAGLAIDDSVLRRMDTRNLFCYLDIINGLRAQPAGSYNVLLTLEGLLIDWAEGLVDCGLEPPADGMDLMLASR